MYNYQEWGRAAKKIPYLKNIGSASPEGTHWESTSGHVGNKVTCTWFREFFSFTSTFFGYIPESKNDKESKLIIYKI